MTALQTQPNAAIPAALRKRAYDENLVKGATKHAAGILHVAPDGDILLLRRGGVPGVDNFVGHWSLPGGGVEDGEAPQIGAARENQEEMGVDVDPSALKDLHKAVTPTGMAFHTFASAATEKFVPKLNDEHTGYAWASLDMLPRPMHPAVEALMRERVGVEDGMAPEDLAVARDGLAAWVRGSQQAADADFNESDHPRMPDGKFGGGGGGAKAADLADRLEQNHPGLKVDLSERSDGVAILSRIVVPKDDRSKGAGSAAMKQITAWADAGGKTLALSPSSDFGGSKSRLLEFYKRFGFVENKGRNKDFSISESMVRPPSRPATDSAMRIAMDRDSVRTFRRAGQLCVSRAHITKANVCPYRGEEIPGWKELGLDKDAIYQLLRDPEELRKAAPSLNGVQLLRKHKPVSAADHKPYDTVGSIGSNAEFDGEYLDNSIYVNAKEAIDGIEDESQRELSAGYHYTPDMTPGNFRGTRFDGVMRDIEFNHVALVKDGRAGDDVVVGDSTENLMAKPTRFAALALSTTAAALAPLLAMDQKLTLPKSLFAPLTTKNFAASKAALLAGVRQAVDGKLRKGLALDASMAGLARAIDAFEELEKVDEPAPGDAEKDMDAVAAVAPIAPEAVDPTPVDNKAFDAEPLKAFLRGKGVGDADIETACGMLPKGGAADAEESDEDKAAREKKDKEDKEAKDAEMKNMVTKPAMDAAILAATTAATKQVRETERGIRAALSEVKPWVGELPASIAFDSAAGVYRQALTMRGVEGAAKLHDDALLPVLLAQPKPGAKPPQNDQPHLAMDATAVGKAKKMAPGLENISVA